MNFPGRGDYIDIHNHGGVPADGIFCVENLMAHEEREPGDTEGLAYTIGIHPWHLEAGNLPFLISTTEKLASHKNIFAIGEAGFDKLRGADIETQRSAFRYQAELAEKLQKPLFIHCVKGWDELLAEHTDLRPSKPWLVHGFRGSFQLAMQLIKRNMYISFWFSFIVKPASDELLKALPPDRIFLETDGSGESIASIYNRVANVLGTGEEELKSQFYKNYLALAGM